MNMDQNRVESNMKLHSHACSHITSHASMTTCMDAWGGWRLQGRWEGLTAPAEQPAALCTWISSLRKSAQERGSYYQSQDNPWGDMLICFSQSMTCFFLTNAPPYMEMMFRQGVVKRGLDLFLEHWVRGYTDLNCKVYYANEILI